MTIIESGSKDVKDEARNAYKAFSHAERKLTKHIDTLTEKCLGKEARLSKKKDHHRQLLVSLKSLNASLDEKRRHLQEQDRRVSSAKRDVQRAVQSFQRAREEFEKAEKHRNDVRTAGWATIWIPIVGATMLAVAETCLTNDVENAEHRLNSVRLTLSNARDTLSEMSNNCQQTENELQNKIDEKESVAADIANTELYIQATRKYITAQNSSLVNMRKVIHKLSLVSGRAEILRDETKLMYDIAQIGEPLKNLVESLEGVGVARSELWIKVLSRPAFKAVGAAEVDEW
ncbi:tropomyosin-like [Haliotis asinina]|uniref:tropomyosin-like n=1 Tax=Haliotis asinina TaxID=109174 RepID=UPI0035320099